MRRLVPIAAGLALALSACGLEERDDFLVGRPCDRSVETPCDEGQVCLPHEIRDGVFDAFRCRDGTSFEPSGGQPAPLAYCDEEAGLVCPDGLVCNADRIRLDAGVRRRVCKRPDDPFAPPLDAGPEW